jgi:hypothetical protein
MVNRLFLETLVLLGGVGQLALALASLAIPHALGWREETDRLRPLTRQVFWTYAVYIWSFNLAFGLLSALAPGWLLDRSPLAGAASAFIAAYWGARLVIQFAVFDRAGLPAGFRFRLAEAALVALFLALAVIYTTAAVFNLGGMGP